MRVNRILSLLFVKALDRWTTKSGILGLLLFSLVALPLWAGPKDLKKYDVIDGGLVDVKPGAYVEGSVAHGGIQPDYIIDLHKEPLKTLLQASVQIGEMKIEYWAKVKAISNLIREEILPKGNYNNPSYRRLLKQHRDAGKDIPLSRYGVCGAGVCRENALVLHFALKAAGIKNKHAYAKVVQGAPGEISTVEDHAFVVLKHKGVEYVVDTYNDSFNGAKLSDLMSPIGAVQTSIYAPIGTPYTGFRRILNINNFPRIYNPKQTVRACKIVHTPRD